MYYKNLIYDACKFSKHICAIYLSTNNSSKPFKLIHSNRWGTSQVVFFYRWIVTFINCYSRTTYVYLMHNKSEVFSYFKRFDNMMYTI